MMKQENIKNALSDFDGVFLRDGGKVQTKKAFEGMVKRGELTKTRVSGGNLYKLNKEYAEMNVMNMRKSKDKQSFRSVI